MFSNDIIGTAVYGILYAFYYFYCFSVSALIFGSTSDQSGVRGACMDGIYNELNNVFSKDYGNAFPVSMVQPTSDD